MSLSNVLCLNDRLYLIYSSAEMTTLWTEPLAASSADSVPHAAGPSSSKFCKCLPNKADLELWLIKRILQTQSQTRSREGGQVKSVAALHRNRPSLLSWRIQIWPCPGAFSLAFVDRDEKQVVIESIDWAVDHLEDLRIPFLVLHGIEDHLSLLSGSRWAKDCFFPSSIASFFSILNNCLSYTALNLFSISYLRKISQSSRLD